MASSISAPLDLRKVCAKKCPKKRLTTSRPELYIGRAFLQAGGLDLIGKAAVLKTAGLIPLGSSSLPLSEFNSRFHFNGEVAELVYCNCPESSRSDELPSVQIGSSLPFM